MDNKSLIQAAAAILASNYRNPDDWFVEWAQGGRTDSGVSVNASSALTYSSVFACVDIISSDVASLRLNDTNVDDEGNTSVNARSPIQWLLNHQPNENMTAFSFRKTLQSHVLLHGNGYAAIERDMTNVPRRLIPIHPTNISRIVADDDNRLWYDVVGIKDFISAADMLHVVGLSDDGIFGYSVVSKARNSWGLGLAEERHGSSHFKHGASPKVILKTQRNLEKEDADELLAQWASEQEGSHNAGKTALAAGGLEIETVAISNEDAQWLESRKFQKAEVATWFTLPEHMINGERGPYNSTIAENQAYLRRTLKKHLCTWEQESEKKLFPDRDRRSGRRVLTHDTSDILSSDPETKAKIAVELVAGEVYTRNEARSSLGKNRHDSPIADELSSPNTRSDNNPSSEPEPDQTEAIAAHRKLLNYRLGRLISAERNAVINRGCKSKSFINWIDTFYEKHEVDMASSLQPILDACHSLSGAIAVTATELAKRHTSESKRQLLEVAGYSMPTELVTNTTEIANGWDVRAETITKSVLGDVTCTK